MNAEEKESIRLLNAAGAVLERTKKHRIWRFPDGRIHVMPSTPSCSHAWKNQLSDLKKFLGLAPTDRGKPGERRPRREKKVRRRMIMSECAPATNNVRVDLGESASPSLVHQRFLEVLQRRNAPILHQK